MEALEEELDACQYAAIQAGTFLLLEKLRVLTLRRLLKRTQLLHAALEPGKAHQLPLGAPSCGCMGGVWQGS